MHSLSVAGSLKVSPVIPTPRLKIAHLYQESGIQFHQPHAAQLHIYHTIDGLQRAGHAVTLLALQGRQVLCTQDLQVFTSDARQSSHYAQHGLGSAPVFRWIESGLRRLQAEFGLPYLALFDSYRMAEAGRKNLRGVHVIHERFNLLALGGAWASRRLGIPFVLEVNADLLEQRKFKGIQEKGLRRLFAHWATRYCFNSAAKIICISSDLKNHLRSHWKIEESKLAVLPCAADVHVFNPNRSSELARRRMGLTNEPVVMWVGGFYPWHDLDLLLESFVKVLQRYPGAKLVLVGDGQTRSSIESKVLKNGLQHAVILTGSIPHHEVPEVLSIADVAVVPTAPVTASRGGTGTPLKLFEYMAAGKAIVATASNEAVEVILHGYSGLLVEAGNSHGFAKAMLRLLNDPADRARLGQNAREQAIKQYSWEQYTQQLEEIYLSVLGNAQPRSSEGGNA